MAVITVLETQKTIFAKVSASKGKRKRLVRRLRSKFRLVVMNDQTLEERFSLRLTPMNVIVVGGTFALTLITITLYVIAFTGLREYIPGYADVNMRRNLLQLARRSDSLDYHFAVREQYLLNLYAVMNGDIDTLKPPVKPGESALFDSIRRLERSEEDSMLRQQMESADRFELDESDGKDFSSGIGSYSFFTPLKGAITTRFNPGQKHYGIDIVAGPDEVIKSTLDGTVVIANFTSETGYVIGVQHGNNLLSFYKHNSALLKKAGDFVKAGEVLAIIGNTGEYSSGPHLHFELWYNGSPVNPVDFIRF